MNAGESVGLEGGIGAEIGESARAGGMQRVHSAQCCVTSPGNRDRQCGNIQRDGHHAGGRRRHGRGIYPVLGAARIGPLGAVQAPPYWGKRNLTITIRIL